MNGEQLTPEALAEAMPGRPLRTYPAMLSTEADALAWARRDAPSGAVVVARYQASPRGRAGREWTVDPDRDACFSLVLRPAWPPLREGWLYAVAVSGLADVIGDGATIEWPDQVRREGVPSGAVGMQSWLSADRIDWAVVTVLVSDPPQRRPRAIADVVEAIEARAGESAERLLADYRPRCETLGRRVRARMIPLGPSGPEVSGRALTVVTDGALVLETGSGRRVAVRPQNLGALEEADAGEAPPEGADGGAD